ncbi:MAG TPA: UDP-N-acetylmuramoyl-L-alanine--D-glutamate ligase [Achromobacter sp.]|nr:UDP-N-acetylmuramoyl-L-alanine--D-glutamate ligase [Achromobacter sp.]
MSANGFLSSPVATVAETVAWLHERVSLTAHLKLDSRDIEPGDVFVACPGLSSDGRLYIDKALALGASAVLFEAPATEAMRAASAGTPMLAVTGLRSLLGELGDTWYGRPSAALAVVAVTGTNGKTTVTALTRQLVEASGLTVIAAGNISPAALSALMDALDSDALPQVWVLELSSFQLETTRTLMADAAVVLNVTQDHLDWHGGMQAYADAKGRLLKMSRVAIVNRDDPLTVDMVSSLNAMNVRSFGRDVPELVGDMGLELGQGVAWLTACESNDFDEPAPPTRRKKDAPEPVRAKGRMSRLMPVDALRIRGIHNALNALAALQLARCLDLGWGAMLRALRDYAGEPHRAAFVRTIGGVDYINDSIGTNVGATVAALEGLGQPVVLIAGGQGKGQDFSPLIPVVSRHARAVMLIGLDGPEIGRVLEPTGVKCLTVETLRDAVRGAAELAQPGDAVLLSPACASLDMFRNYPHRGQVFVEEVEDLARDRGEVA